MKPMIFTVFLGGLWIGIKKYDDTLKCSTDPNSIYPTCSENITYWTDSNATARSTSQFGLNTWFYANSACVLLYGKNFLYDMSCSYATYFLCQKRCRMSGNDIIKSFLDTFCGKKIIQKMSKKLPKTCTKLFAQKIIIKGLCLEKTPT